LTRYRPQSLHRDSVKFPSSPPYRLDWMAAVIGCNSVAHVAADKLTAENDTHDKLLCRSLMLIIIMNISYYPVYQLLLLLLPIYLATHGALH
jgi:hypothetical protein